MENSCNVVSLTKLHPTLNSNNVETEQVLNAILSNYQYIQFDSCVDEHFKERIYDILNKLTDDIIYIHNNIAPDLTIDLKFKQSDGEFEITVNLLQTGQLLDSKLFDYAIEYYDKYENYVIDRDLVGVIFVDFNTMTKNENLHIITRYSDGVINNG